MKPFFRAVFLFLLLLPAGRQMSHAQQTDLQESHRLLIVIHTSAEVYSTSGSQAKGRHRLTQVAAFIKQLAEALYAHNAEVELSLARAAHPPGSSKERCTDLVRLVPFGLDNRAQIALRLEDLIHNKRNFQAWELSSIQKMAESDSKYRYRTLILSPRFEDCYIPSCARKSSSPGEPAESLYLYFTAEGNDCPGLFLPIKLPEDRAKLIQQILPSFPQLIARPATDFAGTPPRRRHSVEVTKKTLPVKAHDASSVSSADTAAPGLPPPPSTTPPAVQFTPGSKMRSADVYGTIQFQISRPVPVIYLFREDGKGNFFPDQEVFTLGLNRLKVQLPPGTYRAVYHPEGLGWNKEFEVKVGEVIGIWLR